MDFVGPVCEFVKCLWDPLVRQIHYVKNLKENFKKLNKKATYLYAKREDVNIALNRGTVLKMPTNECKAWLDEVDKIEKQVKEIEEEFQTNKRCLSGWCPDIWWRKKLGKCLVSMIDDVTELINESDFKGGVVVDAPMVDAAMLEAPLEIVERTATPTIKGETSTDRTVQKILRCIKNEEIQKIGVWGMGGVGKTTVMKILNNLPELTQMFQIIIWVTVSKDWSVRNIQKEIARRLLLELKLDDSNDSVANKLFQKLESIKYLLLLDDVWSMVNLEEVGVPCPSKSNGCKMVLTSRFRDVCNKMGTDENIKVEVLFQEEAWDLFHAKVGDVVDSADIKTLARAVVKECEGLPLAILVIGGSLRKVDDVHVWKNAVKELKSATFEIGDMEELVFNRLKFSYERLKNDNVKNCFLYCALFPEDYEISALELIEYWRVEGLIDGTLNLEEAYDKGHTILNVLADASLLEKCFTATNELHVRMHDVIRGLALRVTSPKEEKGCKFLVRAGVGIEECLNVEEWEHSMRISLMNNKLCRLPERPTCTLLTTLLLQNNLELNTIPESFFEHMHNLEVLNLSNTGIKMLPSSLSNLVSLRAFFLSNCDNLESLPSQVGDLKSLEVLHLGNNVEYLPIEVKQLTRLRSLQVTFTIENEEDVGRRRMLSRGVIPSLDLWKDQQYTSFHLSVRSKIYKSPSGYSLTKVKVGHKHERVRHLKWCGGGGDNIPSAIMEALNQACCFTLENHQTVKKLSDLGMENMNGLHFCCIRNFYAIETIGDENAALQNIQILILQNLPKLRSIWDGAMPLQSFSALTHLHVEGCDKLSNVFSRGMFQHMSNLEVLCVNWCWKIEEIVNEEGETTADHDTNVVILSKLKSLELCYLPNLVRVCKTVSMPWPSLNRIVVEGCGNLKNLPLSVVHDAPALSEISGGREWWEVLEWVDDDIKQQLQPIFTPFPRYTYSAFYQVQ